MKTSLDGGDSSRALAGSSQIKIDVAGTQLVLMATKMVWWPSQKTLLLADAHFGKAATFRKAGIPVPEGTTRHMLATLSSTVLETSAERLVVLGDFIHSSTRARRDFEEDLVSWRAQHRSLPITLVQGNHDRHYKEIFAELEFELAGEDRTFGPFLLCHDPTNPKYEMCENFRLGGHLHPGFKMAGGSSKMLPCFWMSNRFLVFPAFGAFTGMARMQPATDDNVFVIYKNEIARVHPSR